MRYVGICKFATFHRTLSTGIRGRRITRPLLACSTCSKPLIPVVVHLIQSRTESASIVNIVERLFLDAPRVGPTPPESEVDAQENSKEESFSQMAKFKAKKKANALGQAVASTTTTTTTTTLAFVRGDSNAKVTKSQPKAKKNKNKNIETSAAMASQMQTKASAGSQASSSQGSVYADLALTHSAPVRNNSMLPQDMGGFPLHRNGLPVDATMSSLGQTNSMGNFGLFGLNPLAQNFSQQPPNFFMPPPHVNKRNWRQPPTVPRLMAMSSTLNHPKTASQSFQGAPRAPRAEEAHGHGGSSQAHIPMTNDRIQKKYGKRDQQKAVYPPSAESGGVPDPTQEYLKLASQLPIRLPRPKPILIVLDLNGTLLFRPSKNPKAFVARTHALTFLDYLLSRFWVAIWSSARPANVSAMIDNLIKDREQRDRLVAIWGRDMFGLSSHDYSRRVQVYKRLTHLWIDPKVATSHPGLAQGERWDQTNTVLVDDSVEKARSEPHNLICVPEFTGNLYETPEVLPHVHDYLNELSFQQDVSRYIRTAPFIMQ